MLGRAARLFPLLITLVFTVLLITHLQGRDWVLPRFVWSAASLGGILMFWMGGVLVRTAKYHMLLRGSLGFTQVLGLTLVRNAAVDLLPARAAAVGFFLYMGQRLGGLRPAFSVGVFFYAALYDQMAMVILLMLLLPFLPVSVPLWPLLSGGILLLVFLWVVMGRCGERALGMLKGREWGRVRGRLVEVLGILEQMHRQQIRWHSRALLLLLGWAGRVFKYLLAGFLFFSLSGEPLRFDNLALFIPSLALVELSSLLPLQGLGGFGTWEGAFVLVFTRVFPQMGDPLLIGASLHLLTQVGEYLPGGVAWLVFLLVQKKAVNTKV